MWKTRFALVGLVTISAVPLAWGDGSPVFHLDFSRFEDVSGNSLPLEVGDAVSLVPGGGPSLANGVTLDSARWEGEEDDTNQILVFDHDLLDAVSVSAGSIVTWIKPEDGDEWNNIAKTPCEDHIEPCDAFSRDFGIEFQASGPHAGVFGAVQGWNTNVFGPDTPLGEGGETDTPSGEWTHAALTWNDDGDHTIYVNGEPGDTVVGVGDFDFGDNETGDWTIGGDALGAHAENVDATRYLHGELADFAIFDGELTRDDIVNIMSSGVATSDPGDFNRNGEIDAVDLDVHAQMIKDMDPTGDLNDDGSTDASDRRVWIETVQRSWTGDANFDSEFNSGDLVATFTAGKYETGEMATYAEGDWNGDMVFDSGDLVFAFAHGGYELGPPVPAVPEPGAPMLIVCAVVVLFFRPRRASSQA